MKYLSYLDFRLNREKTDKGVVPNIFLFSNENSQSIRSCIRTGINTAIFTLVIFLISSCSRKQATEAQEEPHIHEMKSEVEIDSVQYRQLELSLSQVERRNMKSMLRTTGYLKVPPQNKASITSVLGGTVESIRVMEGDYVQKGQTLATLSNPAFIRMQEEYLQAKSRLAFAQADYQRQKELHDSDVASLKTFQHAETEFVSLQAKVNSLRRQLELMNVDVALLTTENIVSAVPVKSPISGNISHIEIHLGTSVDASREIMDVVDNSHLHLDMFLFEQDLLKVKVGQEVEFWLTNLPGKHYRAKIFGIGSAFEGESRSISVHADITGDKKGLIEGMNVTAVINTRESEAMAVPTTAITSHGGSEYIFIRQDEDHIHPATDKAGHHHAGTIKFRRVEVKKGTTNDGYTEVIPLEEIPDKSAVVSNGSFYLNSMLTHVGGEHEH